MSTDQRMMAVLDNIEQRGRMDAIAKSVSEILGDVISEVHERPVYGADPIGAMSVRKDHALHMLDTAIAGLERLKLMVVEKCKL